MMWRVDFSGVKVRKGDKDGEDKGGIMELKIREVKNVLGCGSRSVKAKIVEPCITYNVFYAPSLYGIRYPIM